MQQKQQTLVTSATTTLNLPRSEWPSHPNYPQQVLLMGAHQNFREISLYVVTLVKEERVPKARRLFSSWMMAMRGHEHYEESKLFKYLSQRYGLSMSALEEGHDEFHEKEAWVNDGFAACAREDSQEHRDALVEALLAYRDVLWAHLKLEEDTVIPLLLAMTPEEFRRYYNSDIQSLLEELKAMRDEA